jgi:hypothetical protein
MLWHLECSENTKAMKQTAVYSDIINIPWNNIHFNIETLFRMHFNILSGCRSVFTAEYEFFFH